MGRCAYVLVRKEGLCGIDMWTRYTMAHNVVTTPVISGITSSQSCFFHVTHHITKVFWPMWWFNKKGKRAYILILILMLPTTRTSIRIFKIFNLEKLVLPVGHKIRVKFCLLTTTPTNQIKTITLYKFLRLLQHLPITGRLQASWVIHYFVIHNFLHFNPASSNKGDH